MVTYLNVCVYVCVCACVLEYKRSFSITMILFEIDGNFLNDKNKFNLCSIHLEL